ncbi:glycosyltransferase family A protein [Halobacterium salinarum]|uniref:glycosyltransferase family 2 protein n=1 Tax=Halobacterium salinarum TaxID=2242 RepID=UPI002554B22F|nr:glycosyltransferase family A protein [Halobacterium salinarum]MDL0130994.1 glycosyltransferase family A protein [Halobacterium salinarum]
MTSTGIAVFAYNRPDHLKRVLSGLQRNDVEHVYIFTDGARNEQDQQRVSEVREIIDQIEWCRTTVTAHERNIGLAESLTGGIERVFEDHEQIIVLEDDCVPAPNFVSFMNTSLERYADDERVMNVNGYSPPVEIPDNYPYDVYFTYRSSSWGWGTWRSAWEHFERDPLTVEELERKKNELKRITDKAGKDLYPMMRAQLEGSIDSWAVWWSFAIAANDGLCLNPVDSKVRNIGHDGTGTHTGESDKYDVNLDTTPVNELDFPEEPFVDSEINSRYNQFIGSGDRSGLKQYGAELLKRMGLWN